MTIFSRILIASIVLILSTGYGMSVFAADAEDEGPIGKTYYTQVNIWFEKPKKIYGTNYHVGAIIPVGTKVKIKDVRSSKLIFTDEKHDTVYAIINKKKHNNISIPELLDKWFSKQDVMAPGGKFSKFTEKEQKAIKSGIIEVGMSREAVLMAYGYPPTIRTPSLDTDRWTYWRNRWITQVADFKDDKVSNFR